MMQTWWIRRWYFLYINACIILHILALSKSFQFRHITFYTNNTLFIKHCLTKQLIIFNSFYLVTRLTLHLSIHIIWYYRFSNGLQSKTNYKVHDWLLLNISLKTQVMNPTFTKPMYLTGIFMLTYLFSHVFSGAVA